MTIFLKNVGDAPTLQNRFVAAPEDWEVSKIIKFIRNELKRDDRTSVVSDSWDA